MVADRLSDGAESLWGRTRHRSARLPVILGHGPNQLTRLCEAWPRLQAAPANPTREASCRLGGALMKPWITTGVDDDPPTLTYTIDL